MKTIYQVSKNLTKLIPEEVKYVRKTDSFYWVDEKRRYALNTDYYKSFETKEEALEQLKSWIQNKTYQAENNLKHYNELMNKFKTLNL